MVKYFLIALFILCAAPVNAQLTLHESSVATTGFKIVVFSPEAWKIRREQRAEREMVPVDPKDIASDVWRITAFASTPRRVDRTAIEHASSVKHIVVRTEDKSIILHPIAELPFDNSVQNSFGATMAYHGITARFDGAAIRNLWGPEQDREFVITVFGDRYNHDFVIKKTHFWSLR